MQFMQLIRLINIKINNCFSGKNLLTTNVISSGVLLGLGDIIQQEIEFRNNILPKPNRYDYKRIGRMFLVGLGQGPLHHYFYKYLDSLFPRQDLITVVKKVLVDQFVASPMFITTFFYGIGFLENRNFTQCTDELKTKFWTIYQADWCFWPPNQFINFYFIPPKYRVFYINMATMIYDVYLSHMKHTDVRTRSSSKDN